MQSMIVKEKQSIFDIALIGCGSAESAFALALANDISITDDLTAGEDLQLTDVVNKSIVDYYTQKGIVPATALTAENITDTIQGEGIEFWAIEYDFIIS